MKTVYKGHVVEGTPAEIKELIEANPSTEKVSELDRLYDPPPHLSLDKFPVIDTIKEYIKEKPPDYVCSWADIQDHFIGHKLKSR